MTPELKRNAVALMDLFPAAGVFNQQMKLAELTAPASALATRTPVVAVYCRRSSEVENDSIERQMERAKEYALQTFKCGISYSYADAGVSGEVLHRDGLDRLLVDARAGRINVLIVEAVDRLGRKLGIISGLTDEFAALGIEVHSVTERKAVENVDVALRGLMATEHQRLLRDRVNGGKRIALANERIISEMPYGYIRDPRLKGAWLVDETAQPTIEWMFNQRVKGMSVADIYRGARAMSPRPDLLPKSLKSIASMLRNPIYTGTYIYGRIKTTKDDRGKNKQALRHPSEWTVFRKEELRIIDDALWERVNMTFHTGNRVSRVTGLLNGKITCSSCGATLRRYGARSSERAGFTCADYTTIDLDPDNRCKTGAITIALVEDMAFEAIRSLLCNENLEALFKAEVQDQFDKFCAESADRRKDLLEQKQKIGDKIEQIFDSANQNLPAEFIEARNRKLTEEWEMVTAKLRDLPNPDARLVLDNGRRQSLLETFDRLADQLRTPTNEFDPANMPMLASLRELIIGATLTPMMGTRSMKMAVKFDVSKLLGANRLPSGFAPPEITAEKILHRLGGKLPMSVFQEGVDTRHYFLTDAEFERVMGKFGADLEICLSAVRGSNMRDALDWAVHVASTSISDYIFWDFDMIDEYRRTVSRSLSRLYAHSQIDRILEFLESEFPGRKGTFNYGVWKHWEALSRRKVKKLAA